MRPLKQQNWIESTLSKLMKRSKTTNTHKKGKRNEIVKELF